MAQRPNSDGRGSGSDMARGFSQASRGLSIAFGFVATALGFWLVGRLIDSWLNTEPWAQVVGAIVGWTAGTVVVFYASQRSVE